MKYLILLKKYIWIFVGAVFFGLAAVKLKSAQRSENKANNKLREQTQSAIDVASEDIDKSVNNLKAKQAHSKEVKANAIKKLDSIAKNSGSVGSLLDDYNRDRV